MKTLIISFIFILISITGMFIHAQYAVDAYLWSWIFWLQFPLGALGISVLHDLTGGRWGDSAKKNLNSMIKSFWIIPLLFLPLLFNLNQVYPWSEDKIKNKTLLFKTPFFEWPIFSLRALIYFFILFSLTQGVSRFKNRPYFSAIALLLYILIMSLISVDWFMSREPEWYSNTYGLIWIFSQTITAWAFVLILKLFDKRTVSEINADQGSLFLIFIVSWAYLSFMQFLIIWSGNLPLEVNWYLLRLRSTWLTVIITIAFASLIIPFFILINRKFKSDSHLLAKLALGVLLFRVMDTIWMISPVERPELEFNIWDLTSFFGMGILWIYLFLKYQRSQTLGEET